METKTYPKIIGFLRTVLITAVWGASTAVVSLFTDPNALNGLVSPAIGLLIAGLAGSLEEMMRNKGKGALFGAARV